MQLTEIYVSVFREILTLYDVLCVCLSQFYCLTYTKLYNHHQNVSYYWTQFHVKCRSGLGLQLTAVLAMLLKGIVSAFLKAVFCLSKEHIGESFHSA